MYDGIYEISFVSSKGEDFGGGIVTIKDGAMNGGDGGYMYAGRLETAPDGTVTGRIRVTKWSEALPSVLPGHDNYELDFRGDFHNGDSLDGRAEVVGDTDTWVQISAHRHADAA